MARRTIEQADAPLWPPLTTEQAVAAAQLAAGKTIAEAAEAAGVPARTVKAWRQYDPAFQAELNSQRADAWAANGERLRALVPRAIDALATALDGPDGAKAALAVLKLAGMVADSAPRFGPQTMTAVLEAEGERQHTRDLFAGMRPAPERVARQLAVELYRELEGCDP